MKPFLTALILFTLASCGAEPDKPVQGKPERSDAFPAWNEAGYIE